MTSVRGLLDPALQDIAEAISDFRDSSSHACESVLSRILIAMEEEPLSGFLGAVLPSVEFESWYEERKATVGSMVGSGALTWPPERPRRVALQIQLCRAMVDKRVHFLEFVHDFMYTGRDIQGHVDDFASKLLDPMLRDIGRLTESRVVPPVLFDAMGTLPPSGDATLDALLNDARLKFRDPAPKARSDATEKLWDAWERLKSLEAQGNKRLAVARLLDQCSPEPRFRELLEAEAQGLTAIGNAFQIRHFEAGKTPLSSPAYNDYLFHRLFAMIHLLLFSRSRDQSAA
jgi:hypothetical protein